MTFKNTLRKIFKMGEPNSDETSNLELVVSERIETATEPKEPLKIPPRKAEYDPSEIIKRFNLIANEYSNKHVNATATEDKSKQKSRTEYKIKFKIQGTLKDETKYELLINRSYSKIIEVDEIETTVKFNTPSGAQIKYNIERYSKKLTINNVEFDEKEKDNEAKLARKYVEEKTKEVETLIKNLAPNLYETAIEPKIIPRRQNLQKLLFGKPKQTDNSMRL
ncbi:hypothetical protein HOK51_09340 [Candidatus Woesearchaeota archaeon]|jgi:hypothetical protein|nr:hypothetical protein [Candidatus Woesearchaeota archaeon]MBT6520032.1 hypothetical protein [Candidatus Woesearchaeota archaeon]